MAKSQTLASFALPESEKCDRCKKRGEPCNLSTDDKKKYDVRSSEKADGRTSEWKHLAKKQARCHQFPTCDTCRTSKVKCHFKRFDLPSQSDAQEQGSLAAGTDVSEASDANADPQSQPRSGSQSQNQSTQSNKSDRAHSCVRCTDLGRSLRCDISAESKQLLNDRLKDRRTKPPAEWNKLINARARLNFPICEPCQRSHRRCDFAALEPWAIDSTIPEGRPSGFDPSTADSAGTDAADSHTATTRSDQRQSSIGSDALMADLNQGEPSQPDLWEPTLVAVADGSTADAFAVQEGTLTTSTDNAPEIVMAETDEFFCTFQGGDGPPLQLEEDYGYDS